jgi:hypothetical protein
MTPFTPTYFHGTKADLRIGDSIAPGQFSNFGKDRIARHVYLTATLEAAVWGAELAKGDGPERIYLVQATGELEDDPNVTNKKFPGNPTRSYRSKEPFLVIGEVGKWIPHSPERVKAMKDAIATIPDYDIED